MQPCSWEVTLVRVESAFDVDSAASVKARLSPLLTRPDHVILDLRHATVDSSGLGAILSMQRRLQLEGRLLLVVATDPQFLGLLERAGAYSAVSLFKDAEAAVTHARERAGQPLPA